MGKPKQPSDLHIWDGSKWIIDQEELLFRTKLQKRDEIASARWEEMSAPTTVNGFSALWYADKESMNDMLRASTDTHTAIELGYLPVDTMLQWKTAEGTFVPMSLEDLITVRLLLAQRQQELYTKEAILLDALASAETVAEVRRITWSDEE